MRWVHRLLLFAASGTALTAGHRPVSPIVLPARLVTAAAQPNRSDPAIAKLRAEHPGVAILQPVAADIDQDGDIDVVASSTTAAVEIWINDGSGHFKRESPRRPFGLRADDAVAHSEPSTPTVAVMSTSGGLGLPDAHDGAGVPRTSLSFPPSPSPLALRDVPSDRPTRAPPA